MAKKKRKATTRKAKKKTHRKKSTSAKKTQKKAKKKKKFYGGGARRGLWKGSLSFGLVSIPIYLESAQEEKKISFRMVDKRDHAPVGYKQINKSTGKEIERSNIVKGYEFKKGKYVLMSDADMKKANVKATKSVDIEDFVQLSEIDPMLFEKPYYVVPQKGGEKGYKLLHEVLENTERAAIGKIVLSTVQHLCIIFVREEYLVLELLRFANEVKEIHEIKKLPEEVSKARVSDRELKGAEQLVESMSSEWDPDKYTDTYREDLMKMIKSKIRRGATAEVEELDPIPEEEGAESSNVIDLTALLKRSLDAANKISKRKKSDSSEKAR